MNRRNRFLYWNVQGLANKIYEIKEYLNRFELIILSETWVEEGDEQYLERLLPMDYSWKWTKATRMNLKGRAIGSGLLGFRNAIKLENLR